MLHSGDRVQTTYPRPVAGDAKRVRTEAKPVEMKGTVVGVGYPLVLITPDKDTMISHSVVVRHAEDVSHAKMD